MIWILGIVCLLFWTVLVYIAGHSVGKAEGKKEQPLGVRNIYESEGFEFDPEGRPGPAGPVGATGAAGKDGKDGKTPDASDLIVDENLQLTLSEWIRAAETRLTRVEKKAGLNV